VTSRETPWLALCGLILLALFVLVAWAELRPGYAVYQDEFRALVGERFGPERATQAASGLQQIWLASADRVDRCTTCHLGVSWQGLDDLAEPYRTHPLEPLAHHPVEKFGCTLCHGGQGAATELPDAHGWVAHWDDPLLDSQLAEAYRAKDPWLFVQIRCNACHRYDRTLDGAPAIDRGKPGKHQSLEGKVTRISYEIEKGRTTLEVFRNYEKLLTDNGFEPLYACVNKDCNGRAFNHTVVPYWSGFSENYEDQRYVALKKGGPSGDVYVSLYVVRNTSEGGPRHDRIYAQVDVIEIAKMDVGMEVVYDGIRLTPEQIVQSARDEGVHVIGLSILSGSHGVLVLDVLARLEKEGLDLPVIVGGIIPDDDAETLRRAGVRRIYTPKDFDLTRIMGEILDVVAEAEAAG